MNILISDDIRFFVFLRYKMHLISTFWDQIIKTLICIIKGCYIFKFLIIIYFLHFLFINRVTALLNTAKGQKERAMKLFTEYVHHKDVHKIRHRSGR